MDIYTSVTKLPASKGIGAAFGNAFIASLGGFLAGQVRGRLAGMVPSTKSGGTILLWFISVGLFVAAGYLGKVGPLLREFAAGVAGFVGNDLYFVLRAWAKWGQWKTETAYKAGDVVLVKTDDKVEYWKAEKDIPATPTAEPGKDSRWVRFETAQGITVTEITEFAQALRTNDALLDGIVKEQLLIFGPELAQQMGRDLNQDEANNVYSAMRDSLKSVVIEFSQR